MRMALRISKERNLYGQTLHWIVGFTPKELDELQSMEYGDLKDCVVRLLDERMEGQGTYWLHACWIYSIQFDKDAVVVRTGISCG